MTAHQATDSRGLRTLPILATCCAGVVILWFLALYPLVPKTALGRVVATASGVVIFFWCWACTEIIIRLERLGKKSLAFKIIGYPVAISLGAGVFVAAYLSSGFISKHFSYFFH